VLRRLRGVWRCRCRQVVTAERHLYGDRDPVLETSKLPNSAGDRWFESISLQRRVWFYSAIVGTRAMLQWPVLHAPALQQLGVEPVGFRPAMFARHTRGMDHVRLDPTRRKPTRQPEAVADGLEGQHKPRDSAAGPAPHPARDAEDRRSPSPWYPNRYRR
jgi:hypothetical protein